MKFEEEELTVHNLKRRIMGSLMAVMMSTTTILGNCPNFTLAAANESTEVTADATAVNASNTYGLASVNQGNILHAWDWSLKTIKEQLPEIAKAGYSVVQTSPLQSCERFSNNNDWWKSYQPYDYAYGSVYGSEEEFKELCEEAHKYGISIIVDVVANHVAGSQDGSIKSGVDSFWTSNKNGLFHNKSTKSSDKNRVDMVLSNIGMPDINTENEKVQARLVDYMQQLINDGADGFRFDAAKHIGTSSDTGDSHSDFWKNTVGVIKAKYPDKLYYGEILNDMQCTPDPMTYYVKDGLKVTESQVGWGFKDAVQKKTLATHAKSGKAEVITYNRSTVCGIAEKDQVNWVENHDTYLNYWGSTGRSGASNYMSDDQVMLSWSALASRADTQSLFFARPDGCSNPDNPNPTNDDSNHIDGTIAKLTSNTSWKNTKVASVNQFKNAMIGENESVSTSGNTVIVKRGTKGAVVTNFGSSDSTVEVTGLSGLADGSYKDASGQNGTITVSGGKASISVKGSSFAVLYDADAKPVETEAPETIAPTETPVEGAAKVTVSKDSGTFEKSFDVDVKVEDAEYAYYSYDGADWAEIKDGKATVTVGEDAKEVGDEFALYVKAKGADGKTVDVTKKYTYTAQATATATEAPVTGLKVRVKKSDYDTAPHIYLYTESTPVSEPAGKWPGTLMTEEGDYYVYTNASETSSVLAIFNGGEGKWQDPDGGEQAKGYSVSGYVEYAKGTVSKVEGGSTDTSAPATVSPKAKKAGKAPEFVEPGNDATPTPVVATTEPTEAPTPVAEETQAPVAEETQAPVVKETPSISVDVADGSEFDTETMEVTVTAKNATNATYTIDGGATKSFSDSTVVTIGEGKIADSEVTLKVTATDGQEKVEQIYTYKKVFNPGKAAETQEVKVSAIVKLQSAMEIVKDAAQANATATAESDGYYATNPNQKVGKNASIKIDGDFSDWSEDMLVAQGVACDTATRFKGVWENWVMDSYSLYGAWDDENLYIGWQIVNTYDTFWQQDGNGPISDSGKPGDAPQFIAINTGKGNKMTGLMQDGKGIWSADIQYSSDVDNIIAIHSDLTGVPGLFKADSTGASSYVAADGLCLDFKSQGIEVKKVDGCLPDKIMGVWNPGDENDHASYDLSSNWVDMKTTDLGCRKHDTAYDTFYEMKIPFKALGITKDDVTNNGVNIMHVISRGESGMDCTPHDPSMLDNTYKNYGAEPSNSHEKDDTDIISVPLAAVGSTKAIGQGAGSSVVNPPISNPTPTPVETEDPDVTATPVETEDPDVTATPVVTEDPGVTTPEPEVTEVPVEPEVTATPVVTEAPAATPVATEAPKATPVTVQISETDKMVVNFGANLSAPQMSGKELTLEAKPMNTKGACQYQFAIDGVLAQGYSENATYVWTPDTGSHTIQVSVKDAENNTVVVEKKYTVEGEALPTVEPTVEPTTVPTAVPTPTAPAKVDNNQKVPNAATTSSITASLTVNPAKSAAVKTKVTLVPNVTGFKTSYTYSIIAKKTDGTVTQIVKDSNAASATWVPKSAGTYTLTLKVVDAEKNAASFEVPSYKITKLKLSTAKASKKTIKAGSKVKFTAKATSASGSVKYQFVVKKGSKKIATRKYNKKATYTWTAKKTLKAGTYKCVITAKDSSGVKVSKTVSVKVKAKAKAKKAKKAKK